MVRSGFRNLCFRNRFVTEMHGTACGMSRESHVGCFVWYLQKKKKKIGLSKLSPNYFRGQAWLDLLPGMANVCYCHKLNNMLNM